MKLAVAYGYRRGGGGYGFAYVMKSNKFKSKICIFL